jgi:hypothetical protein
MNQFLPRLKLSLATLACANRGDILCPMIAMTQNLRSLSLLQPAVIASTSTSGFG